MLYGTIAEHIYASRLLSGLAGGGIQTAMTIYFAEISDDSIRGILGTSYQLSRCFGILITYILEVYINYIQLSMIMIVLTLAYAVSFFTMPPTPQYLLKIGADEVSFDFSFIFRCKFNFEVETCIYREPEVHSNTIPGSNRKIKSSTMPFSDSN